jgi:hypothetical protein
MGLTFTAPLPQGIHRCHRIDQRLFHIIVNPSVDDPRQTPGICFSFAAFPG